MILITPTTRQVSGGAVAASPAGTRAPLPTTAPLVPAMPAAPATAPAGGSIVLVPGQVLQALVLRGGESGAPVQLQVDGKPLDARTAVPLSAGQLLNLSVRKTGAETVLQLVGSDKARQATLGEGLRLALPRQLPLPESLSTLLRAVRSDGSSQLPAPVHKALLSVRAAMPASDDLQAPTGLRDALRNSGLFLESRVATLPAGTPLPAGDLKAALLRLATAIRTQADLQPRADGKQPATGSSPDMPRAPLPELLALGKASEGALHRIQSQQLQNVAAQSEQPGLLSLEVPVRGEQQASLLKLRVRDDAHRQDDGEARCWQVVVDLDLGTAGALQAHVTLRDGAIGATLRIAEADTADAARSNLAELAQRLQEAGLDIGSLVCVHAPPLADDSDATEHTRLLETQA